MSPASSSTDIASGVSKLTLDTQTAKAQPKPKPRKQEIADSWEDEDVSEGEIDTPLEAPQGNSQGTSAPPSTPLSPSYGNKSQASIPSNYHIASNMSSSSAARPEKTDAVARRMIAGALGLRAPKQTEEQKAYQKAIREKERKRREEEKAAEKKREEEAARAKAAIWDD